MNCAGKLIAICVNKSSSVNYENLQICKSIIVITEPSSTKIISETVETTVSILETTETPIVTSETETTINVVDIFKKSELGETHQEIEGLNHHHKHHPLSYEHIWIIIGAITAFIIFGMCLIYQKKKGRPVKRAKNVHEKFEPLDLECATVSADAPLSCPNLTDTDHGLDQSVTLLQENTDQKADDNQEIVLNEVIIDEVNEISIEFVSENEDSSVELDESEEQMRRKTTRSVTFDENQNQTRLISCVGIAPDMEMTVHKTEGSDQVL